MDCKFPFSDDNESSEIDSICLNCGHDALLPDYIYDECGKYQVHKELDNKKVWSLNCGYCNKVKVVPKTYLENKKEKSLFA